MIHILLAAKSEVASVLNAAKTGKPVRWIVPKTAHTGDRAVIHLPERGLAASGVIRSEPRDSGQNGYGRYSATVGEIALLKDPLSLTFLQKNHPTWKWPNYPKGYTTIREANETRLEELLQETVVDATIETPRKPVPQDIMQRRGQRQFRQNLLNAYSRCCAIPGCNAEAALEAAHIHTYEGADVHHIRNGVLLRADLHTLFDLGLICIHTSTWKVVIAPELKGTAVSRTQ